jgi:hypothetical protein
VHEALAKSLLARMIAPVSLSGCLRVCDVSHLLVDEGFVCLSGHKALLTCFSLIVGCVGVVWWLRGFGTYNLCRLFVE